MKRKAAQKRGREFQKEGGVENNSRGWGGGEIFQKKKDSVREKGKRRSDVGVLSMLLGFRQRKKRKRRGIRRPGG